MERKECDAAFLAIVTNLLNLREWESTEVARPFHVLPRSTGIKIRCAWHEELRHFRLVGFISNITPLYLCRGLEYDECY